MTGRLCLSPCGGKSHPCVCVCVDECREHRWGMPGPNLIVSTTTTTIKVESSPHWFGEFSCADRTGKPPKTHTLTSNQALPPPTRRTKWKRRSQNASKRGRTYAEVGQRPWPALGSLGCVASNARHCLLYCAHLCSVSVCVFVGW